MSILEYQLSYWRHLPHIQPPGAIIFVTFRLAGSIPTTIQEQLLAEAAAIKQRIDSIADAQKQAELSYQEQKRLFGRWDAALDRATTGPHWLREPQIAQLLWDSLLYRDGKVYDLDSFCIMSNHAHAVFRPLLKAGEQYHSLSAIMHSLKGYTAREANTILGRKGQFWQHESYDHVVRNEAELARIRRYVLQNPVTAGLVAHWDEWPWSYSKTIAAKEVGGEAN